VLTHDPTCVQPAAGDSEDIEVDDLLDMLLPGEQAASYQGRSSSSHHRSAYMPADQHPALGPTQVLVAAAATDRLPRELRRSACKAEA
jgi:hypothetical protein